MKKEYDYLLVGAGLFNAVFAQQAKMHGKRYWEQSRYPWKSQCDC